MRSVGQSPGVTTLGFLGPCVGCCTLVVGWYSWKTYRNWRRRWELIERISKKQDERRRQFDRLLETYQLTDELKAITELEVDVLLERLQEGNLTAVQVLHAFTAKAVRATEEFNCITEFIPWAEQLAIELDSLPSRKGPLHGLPIAIKDDHDVLHMDTTIGFARNLYKPADKHSTPVQILVDLGAVPFCKTNVPQALASINSDNPIFGVTYNALKKSNSPGGSSGGAGCIVGAGGALVATGSDLAGSLRIPAHFQGLVTLRSTTGRLSSEGMRGGLSLTITMSAVTGFITKDVKSQVTMYKAVTGDMVQNHYDPSTVPLPWNEHLFSSTKPLKIGYYTSLPVFPAMGDTPSIVLKAKQALERKGYQLVAFPMPDSVYLFNAIFGLFWADLGKQFLNEFRDEPISRSTAGTVGHARMPVWLRLLMAKLFSVRFLPTYSARMGDLLRLGMDYQSLYGFTDGVNSLREVRQDVLRRMKEEDVDVLLGPVLPFPSVEERVAGLFAAGIIYTYMWNALDFPAGVVRFGTESGKLLGKVGEMERDHLFDLAQKAMPSSVGLPINVQIIGKPFHEEVVLRALADLENIYQLESHQNNGVALVKNGTANGVQSS